MCFLKRSKLNGFTLVELLVVISIIGVLATLIIVNFSKAQSKSRDSKRKSDLTLIMAGLVNYANDHGGQFIVSDGHIENVSGEGTTWAVLSNNLVSGGYLSALPCDPLGCKNEDGKSDPTSTKSFTGYSYLRGDYTFPTTAQPCQNLGSRVGFVYSGLENSPSSDENGALSTTEHSFDWCVTTTSNGDVYDDGDESNRKYNFKISN